MGKEKNKLPMKKPKIDVTPIPGEKVAEIGMGVIGIGKECVRGYNMRTQFRLEMLSRAQSHEELMDVTDKISDYRAIHVDTLSIPENMILTETFCQKIIAD